MKKNLLLFLIILLHIFVFLAYDLTIKDIPSVSVVSASTLQLHGNDLIYNDAGIPIPIVLFFHNKIAVFVFDVLNRYLQYWNPLFLTDTIGLLGLWGIILGAKYLFVNNKKNPYIFLILLCLLLIPLIKVFMPIKNFILLSPYYIFSCWSYYKYAKLHGYKKALIGLVFLTLISVVWLVIFRNKLTYMQSFTYL